MTPEQHRKAKKQRENVRILWFNERNKRNPDTDLIAKYESQIQELDDIVAGYSEYKEVG